jgi:hypothetical protein
MDMKRHQQTKKDRKVKGDGTPQAASGEEALMIRRVGATAKERLARVLDFVDLDLSRLHDGEVEAWANDLRFIARAAHPMATHDGVGSHDQRITPPAGAIALTGAAPVVSLQKQLKSGLGMLFTMGSWPLPRPTRVWLSRAKTGALAVEVGGLADWQQVLWGVVSLAREVNLQLKQCPMCERPFVQRGRQGYCTPRCSIRMRDRRKAQR